MNTIRKVAYIFEDVNGWYICDESAEMLDTSGRAYPTKNAAIYSVREMCRNGYTDYTHYRTGKTIARKMQSQRRPDMTTTKKVKIETIDELKRAMAREPKRFLVDGWTVARDYPSWADRPRGEYAYLVVNDTHTQTVIHICAVPEDHPEYPM